MQTYLSMTTAGVWEAIAQGGGSPHYRDCLQREVDPGEVGEKELNRREERRCSKPSRRKES